MSRPKRTTTVTLTLDYDGWKDLEGALLDRASRAAADGHRHMFDRLNDIRRTIETQVREQRRYWR